MNAKPRKPYFKYCKRCGGKFTPQKTRQCKICDVCNMRNQKKTKLEKRCELCFNLVEPDEIISICMDCYKRRKNEM